MRWAGEYQFDSRDELGFGIVNLGVDARRRLSWQVAGQRLDVGSYYLHERYLPRWTFGKAQDWVGRSRELHEFGLSAGVPEGWKVFGITFKRFRVGYKKGGEFRGWTFGTEFPF